MKRAEDERREEKTVLSYWESSDGRGSGRKEKMVWLCWAKDENLTKGQRRNVWVDVTEWQSWLKYLLAGWMGCPCYDGREWTSPKGSNRTFTEDSVRGFKESLGHSGVQVYTELVMSLSISTNLITLTMWLSDSQNSSSQNNLSLLQLGWARFASQYPPYDTQQYTIFERKWKVLNIKILTGDLNLFYKKHV